MKEFKFAVFQVSNFAEWVFYYGVQLVSIWIIVFSILIWSDRYGFYRQCKSKPT